MNHSGCLLSPGHPLGATGLAHITEVVRQVKQAHVKSGNPGWVWSRPWGVGGVMGLDGNGCGVVCLGSTNDL